MRIKKKNDADALARLRTFVITCDADFGIERMRSEGVDTDSFDGLVQLVLAGWTCNLFRKKSDRNGFVMYDNGFNASYGWERVMKDMFDAIGPALEVGSYIVIEPDSDYDKAVVRDGVVVWVH